jgi:hypothetical protein
LIEVFVNDFLLSSIQKTLDKTPILATMKIYININTKVLTASLVLILLYTFLGYWSAIIVDDRPSEISIINFLGKNFSAFAKYPLLFFLRPVQSPWIMLFCSFVDFAFLALLIERSIYVIRVAFNYRIIL